MEKLLKIRREIDKIDDSILSLLTKRSEFVEMVKHIKEESYLTDDVNAPVPFFTKPIREMEILYSIIKKNNSKYSNSSLIHIWRSVITASQLLEQPALTLVIQNDNRNIINALSYYPTLCTPQILPSADEVLELVFKSKNPVIAALPFNEETMETLAGFKKKYKDNGDSQVIIYARFDLEDDQDSATVFVARMNSHAFAGDNVKSVVAEDVEWKGVWLGKLCRAEFKVMN